MLCNHYHFPSPQHDSSLVQNVKSYGKNRMLGERRDMKIENLTGRSEKTLWGGDIKLKPEKPERTWYGRSRGKRTQLEKIVGPRSKVVENVVCKRYWERAMCREHAKLWAGGSKWYWWKAEANGRSLDFTWSSMGRQRRFSSRVYDMIWFIFQELYAFAHYWMENVLEKSSWSKELSQVELVLVQGRHNSSLVQDVGIGFLVLVWPTKVMVAHWGIFL